MAQHRDPARIFRRVAHAHEGTAEERRQRYEPIAALVRPGELVVDIGCGEGIFLELVRERGATGVGIELDPVKAEIAGAKGFEIHQGYAQALDWPWDRVDFVSMIHIVEHLPPEDAIAVLVRAYDALSEAGRMFLLTPNIANPVVQTNFWLDVTHVRPYPALLLQTIIDELGCPHHQAGEMTNDLETWCYAFRDTRDRVPPGQRWRPGPLRIRSEK